MSQKRTIQFPVVEEKIDAVIELPALDAYKTSPYWRPLRLNNGILYLWTRLAEDEIFDIADKEKMQEIEAILLPLEINQTNQYWYLYYVTRGKKVPMIILVKPRPPGGNIRNIFRRPIKVKDFDRITTLQFIGAWVLSKKGLSCSPREDYWTIYCYDEENKKHYSVLVSWEELEIEEIQT